MSPILRPEQDFRPGMTSPFRQVALKDRLSSSGMPCSSNSTLERIFCTKSTRGKKNRKEHRMNNAMPTKCFSGCGNILLMQDIYKNLDKFLGILQSNIMAKDCGTVRQGLEMFFFFSCQLQHFVKQNNRSA